MRPMRLRSCCSGQPVSALPDKRIIPEEGSNIPDRSAAKVDLPAPFGPTRAINCPAGMDRESRSRILRPPLRSKEILSICIKLSALLPFADLLLISAAFLVSAACSNCWRTACFTESGSFNHNSASSSLVKGCHADFSFAFSCS
ncbi:hypothetical protein D3C77_412070 [compost metagenome]